MKLKTEPELQYLIRMFLKATDDLQIEHVYLLDNKYFILQSVSDYKSKIQQVRLAETDIEGNYKCEENVTLLLDMEEFKIRARIVGVKSNKKATVQS